MLKVWTSAALRREHIGLCCLRWLSGSLLTMAMALCVSLYIVHTVHMLWLRAAWKREHLKTAQKTTVHNCFYCYWLGYVLVVLRNLKFETNTWCKSRTKERRKELRFMYENVWRNSHYSFLSHIYMKLSYIFYWCICHIVVFLDILSRW